MFNQNMMNGMNQGMQPQFQGMNSFGGNGVEGNMNPMGNGGSMNPMGQMNQMGMFNPNQNGQMNGMGQMGNQGQMTMNQMMPPMQPNMQQNAMGNGLSSMQSFNGGGMHNGQQMNPMNQMGPNMMGNSNLMGPNPVFSQLMGPQNQQGSVQNGLQNQEQNQKGGQNGGKGSSTRSASPVGSNKGDGKAQQAQPRYSMYGDPSNVPSSKIDGVKVTWAQVEAHRGCSLGDIRRSKYDCRLWTATSGIPTCPYDKRCGYRHLSCIWISEEEYDESTKDTKNKTVAERLNGPVTKNGSTIKKEENGKLFDHWGTGMNSDMEIISLRVPKYLMSKIREVDERSLSVYRPLMVHRDVHDAMWRIEEQFRGVPPQWRNTAESNMKLCMDPAHAHRVPFGGGELNGGQSADPMVFPVMNVEKPEDNKENKKPQKKFTDLRTIRSGVESSAAAKVEAIYASREDRHTISSAADEDAPKPSMKRGRSVDSPPKKMKPEKKKTKSADPPIERLVERVVEVRGTPKPQSKPFEPVVDDWVDVNTMALARFDAHLRVMKLKVSCIETIEQAGEIRAVCMKLKTDELKKLIKVSGYVAEAGDLAHKAAITDFYLRNLIADSNQESSDDEKSKHNTPRVTPAASIAEE